MTSIVKLGALVCVTGIIAACQSEPEPNQPSSDSLAPTDMVQVGRVDDRYQSYNVEMLEVTGGKFWKPYGPELEAALRQPAPSTAPPDSDTPSGMNPALYEYRPPIDLSNPRLRKLAAALGPAYVRVSGTWANTTYFPETAEAPPEPPPGFMGVLTHEQWRGVIDFANEVDARIATSFATGMGTRDPAGAWTPAQALRWIDFTESAGGNIAAAEFMNEPTAAEMGGAPPGYDAADYGRDFKLFRDFADRRVPDMVVIGPGSVGETTGDWGVTYGAQGLLETRDLLAQSQPAGVDAFSYHHYGAVSRRCVQMGNQTSPEDALTEQWLRRTDQTLEFYRALRDEFEPGKKFWNTETADAACGGNPWGGTFLDTFRYLDQLGRLARQEVEVVAHNTLVASDYGLLDDKTLTPKPNYWGAWLWRNLMGTTVLDSGVPIDAGRHVYAHCLRGTPGGVALLVINNDRTASQTLSIPTPGDRYTLSSTSADDLQTKSVQLNGTELKLGPNDEMPPLVGNPVAAGDVIFEPATITFLALPEAGNGACR
ncbi:hypothetical protein AU193_17980 [Mycobacterium sp. GA-1285]|uniref:hypothetical protein n=1 Tax=Mycobacterium sp. GA-1285 TaxID=1772282 RepID=UPI0007491631|nr:hypothetical protein [Mycobacterium sp. GA-1285]KUI22159.1 hypothetical protein AU193_17980 [Mycobacterium sp. GA-1285]